MQTCSVTPVNNLLGYTTGIYHMDIPNSVVWFAIGIVFVTTIITKATRGRRTYEEASSMGTPHPPTVNCGSMIGLLCTLYRKGLRAMILDQYKKLGSVFTISFFGKNITILVGHEVADHFYQGMESEIGLNMLDFTVPMTGKEVGYARDVATRCEQARFQTDALKSSKLRSHVGPMHQEVEVSTNVEKHISNSSSYALPYKTTNEQI